MSKDVITKAVVVNFLNESIGLSKRECLNFFENFIDIISNELKNNQNVKIVNFGVFSIRKKKSRIGRNPKTKEEVMISERNVVKFKPSDLIINQSNSNKNST
ncbi:MAG: Integration host factor subunit alpha [Alphaproteobacteria bacterium MarineAlpha8_Bin1]|nr:MAG: Integration host factor subunit alpha [Alphaproteobacteria bacterium MarineAlpha8_Bin1]|tara:strand:+ start:594 stop:899 length:306 start_codon:yes stop_codon:yes gene_type:complete